MSEELKPCPNCPSTNLHYYATDEMVECNNCGELRSLEEWQADTVRESALRAENEQLRRERDALNNYTIASDALTPVLNHMVAVMQDELLKFGCIADVLPEQRPRLDKLLDQFEQARTALDAVREAGNG